ncbi:hypothetical protein GQR58_010431 [Nymphon striatum]|nr:hypothetical protein GQR58_010431 [Nymphon striatum]
MNYIKKKIKGSKKCDSNIDEFESNSLAEKTNSKLSSSSALVKDPNAEDLQPTEPKTDSEEWKAFLKLTQRVEDTVQKSQTSLTKLKESTVTADVTRRAEYDYVSSDEENNEQLKAPAESLKTWVDFNDANDSRTLEELTSPQEPTKKDKPERPPLPAPAPTPSGTGRKKAPSRPPPPSSSSGGSLPPRPPPPSAKQPPKSEKDLFDQQVNVAINKSSKDSSPESVQPARTTPQELDFSFLENSEPEPLKITPIQPQELDFSFFENQIDSKPKDIPSLEFSLHDDFGFEKNPTLLVINPSQTLLLEEDGQPINDPFDTSHVDIITQVTAITPIDENVPDPFDTSFVEQLNQSKYIFIYDANKVSFSYVLLIMLAINPGFVRILESPENRDYMVVVFNLKPADDF